MDEHAYVLTTIISITLPAVNAADYSKKNVKLKCLKLVLVVFQSY